MHDQGRYEYTRHKQLRVESGCLVDEASPHANIIAVRQPALFTQKESGCFGKRPILPECLLVKQPSSVVQQWIDEYQTLEFIAQFGRHECSRAATEARAAQLQSFRRNTGLDILDRSTYVTRNTG